MQLSTLYTARYRNETGAIRAQSTSLAPPHIWVWSQLEPDRLARNVRAALAAPEAELWLSPISV